MNTIFDWTTMIVFGGLVVLFLQRSVGQAHPKDKTYHYFAPAVGCAIANYLGNHGHGTAALLLLIAVVGYILFFLKPFDKA